jgi:hypothetical protein
MALKSVRRKSASSRVATAVCMAKSPDALS